MTVVLVPGLGLSVDAAQPLVDALGQHLLGGHTSGGHRVVTAVPLPSFGRPATGPHDPDGLARLLLERLPAAPGLVLVGHSAGCQVIVRVAVLAPARVAGLVLIGPTTDPSGATWPRLVGRWLRTAVWERPWQVPLLVRDYASAGVPGLLRTMDRMRREPIESDLVSVGCPVLVLRGRHDRIAPQAWIERVAAATPHGKSATLRRGGHMIPLTHPSATAERIAESFTG